MEICNVMGPSLHSTKSSIHSMLCFNTCFYQFCRNWINAWGFIFLFILFNNNFKLTLTKLSY
jgi:hypothetical protein